MFLKKIPRQSLYLAIAILLGLFAGYTNHPTADSAASVVSQIFINLLKLVSLPIIFLSIVSTASGMESVDEIKSIGKKVVKYTLFTTVIAATFALVIFVTIDPVRSVVSNAPPVELESGSLPGYVHYLINVIPSNIIQPFSDNSVIGVLFLAILLSFAILSLPQEKRKLLNSFFSGLYAAIMKITTWIIQLMPFAIWAFVTLFIKDVRSGMEMKSIALYLACVILANLFQAIVVLPTLLKVKKISPVKTAWGMMPALSLAFFAKSSSASLPMAMKCAEERVKISRKVASFSLPLCTTINMNACAAFILTTVLFVSMSNGITYSAAELIFWIFIATIAAVGNAGVPMGCYFIASAFLAAMNVPLNILGVILPFYALIDMLETAINVWSDSCVTTIVQKEIDQEEAASVSASESAAEIPA